MSEREEELTKELDEVTALLILCYSSIPNLLRAAKVLEGYVQIGPRTTVSSMSLLGLHEPVRHAIIGELLNTSSKKMEDEDREFLVAKLEELEAGAPILTQLRELMHEVHEKRQQEEQ